MAATAITTALSTFISTLLPKPPPPPPSPPPPHLPLSSPPIPTITSGLTLNHHPTSVPSTACPAAAYSNVFYLKHRMETDYDEEEEIPWEYADEAIEQFFKELRRSGAEAEWRRRMRFETNRERKIRKAMEAKIKDKWMRIEDREEREVLNRSFDSRFMGGNFFLERMRKEEEQDAQEPLEARAAWEEGEAAVKEAAVKEVAAYYEGEGGEEIVEEAAAYYEGKEGKEVVEEAAAYYEGEEGEGAGAYYEGEEGEEVVEEAAAYYDGEEGEGAGAYYKGEVGEEDVEEAAAYYEGEEGKGAAANYEGEEGEEGEEWGEGGEGEKVAEELWTYHDIDDWEREFGE